MSQPRRERKLVVRAGFLNVTGVGREAVNNERTKKRLLGLIN